MRYIDFQKLANEDAFQRYYDEYMARPQTQKTRENAKNIRRIANVLAPVAGGIVGAGWGGVAGIPITGKFPPNAGTAVGGGIGIGAGLVAAAIIGHIQNQATESALDSEAWRYATMRTNNERVPSTSTDGKEST